MSGTESFDAIILGTGQGGKPLAVALVAAGRRTAIIESDRVGGTCVVRGCTPTKTMVASARVAYLARRAADYGITTGEVRVDLETIRARKRTIVDDWSEGSRQGLERHDLMDLVMGTARFSGPGEITVELNGGGTRTLAAEQIFLNVGARSAVPSLPGLDGIDFLDSTSVMELGRVPDHLVILGGGFIGLEFGQMFRRFGAEVTILERSPRLAMREDEDIAEAIHQLFEEDGIRVLTNTSATTVEPRDGGRVRLHAERDGQPLTIDGDELLVAVGRVSNADTLDLDRIGLATDERGWIPVNDRCETAVEGVWAFGDVSGAPPYTHIAYDDYRIIRNNLLGDGGASRAGRIVPYTVFIDPQLGRVGLTEREAREQGYDVRVAKLPMTSVARAIETSETRGLMKAVVDARTDRILGAAVLGIEGGEVATVLQVAMMGDLPWMALRDVAISHPTVSESLNNLFMTLDT
ncbi:MAG: mercuric reductase [Gemmatimonadota bacterium]